MFKMHHGLRRRSATQLCKPWLAVLAAGTLLSVAACEDLPDVANSAASSSSEISDVILSTDHPNEDAETSEAPTPEAQPADDEVAEVRHKLDELEIRGRAPKTGYSRDEFGQRWKDIDRNGCDQRNDVLARDMAEVNAPQGCKVMSGVLDDPYTGQIINFVRGQDTSTAVHIDHVVALSDAWQKGAQQLTPERREELANDPQNLLASDGTANMQKGDGDAATWLPPNKGFRCQYVAIQVTVKHAYQLWMTQAEHDAIAGILDGCEPGSINPAEHRPAPAPQRAAPVVPAQAVPAPSGGGGHYKNCAAARAAGAAPLYAGQAGYRSALDRDGDGVACE